VFGLEKQLIEKDRIPGIGQPTAHRSPPISEDIKSKPYCWRNGPRWAAVIRPCMTMTGEPVCLFDRISLTEGIVAMFE
jgi:hypothetical protein